jgi:hypothetical protein
MRVFRTLLLSHSLYILITAIWPIIDIKSFMDVTGYKTDIWLVKTVGALLIPVALAMLSYWSISTFKLPATILGGCTGISFITIDCYYALTNVISDIYLADALIELIFLVGWAYVFFKELSKKRPARP